MQQKEYDSNKVFLQERAILLNKISTKFGNVLAATMQISDWDCLFRCTGLYL